jgi:hypothetical protein
VFTGAIYDILADIFVHERLQQSSRKELTQILFEVAQHLRSLVLRAIIASPAAGATFADVANQMILRSKAQNDPLIYRTIIKNRFTVREVVVSAVPFTAAARAIATLDFTDPDAITPDGDGDGMLQPTDHISITEGVPQDRTGCCGTMQLPEYARSENVLSAELEALRSGAIVDAAEAVLAGDFEDLRKAFT